MREQGIDRVAVIGAGLMGCSVGLEFARFGYKVTLYNTKRESSKQAQINAREMLDLMAETELITKRTADAAYKRMKFTTSIEETVDGADFVHESVQEKLALKKQVFAQLDVLCPASVILATNTSSLRISDIAADMKHPERMLATHYYQPPHLVPFVEVCPTKATDPAVVQKTASLLRGMHKKIAVMRFEYPGFIGNRMQGALGREIQELVDKGVATIEEIDDAIRYGFGRRMAYTGWFIRNDLIGLELGYTQAKEAGREPWGPLEERVKRGDIGMKSGKGYYDWSDGKDKKLVDHFNREMIKLLKMDLKEKNL